MPTVSKTKASAAGVCAAQQNYYDNATVCWINADDTNTGPKLLIAARDGDASRVQTLLSVQFYINYTDKDGRTSLLYAVSKGHAPIVEKLISAGSNIPFQRRTHNRVELFLKNPS